MTLFCHGVESAGWVPADTWRALLARHARNFRFLGVNERVYTHDFASFLRLRSALAALPSRAPMPEPLTLDQLRCFLDERGDRYAVMIGPGGAVPPRRREDAA